MLFSRLRSFSAHLACLASLFITALTACSRQEAPSGETQEAINRTIRAHHVPVRLGDSAGLSDWQTFDSLSNNARVIGLGESTHGTEESDAINCALIKHLIEAKGCRMICLEFNAPPCSAINDYVLGKNEDNMQGLILSFNSRSLQKLVEWVRDYNAKNQASVRFCGLNFYFTNLISQRILSMVQKADSLYYPTANELLKGFLTYLSPDGETEHYVHSPDSMQILRRSALEVLNTVQTNKERYAARLDSYNLNEMIQFLHLLVQSVSMPDPRKEKPSSLFAQVLALSNKFKRGYDYRLFDAYRDSCMFENVQWASKQTMTTSPIVVWAHNFHIAKRTEHSGSTIFPSYKRIGAYLQESYGASYFTLGYSFYQGKYIARDRQGKTNKCEAETPPESSIEQIIYQANISGFLIGTQVLSSASGNIFLQPLPFRLVGRTQPSNEFANNTVLAKEFDALIFHQTTTPRRPMRLKPAQ